MVPLEDSYLELIDENGTMIMEGEIPAGRPSHYQRLTLTPDVLGEPIALRVSSPTTTPILWSGESPNKSGTWLSGGLFSIESTFGTDFLNTFATTVDIDLTGSIHLWGEPFRPEEWVGVDHLTLRCRTRIPCLYLLPVIKWSYQYQCRYWYRLVLCLEPTSLTVNTSGRHPDGTTITTVYHPQEGDILSALYYALPPQESTP